MIKNILLDGKSLNVDQLSSLCEYDSVKIFFNGSGLQRVKKSRNYLKTQLNEQIIYGVNTGFGPMASHLINGTKLKLLQKNLITSHAAGIGSPINSKYVLGAMTIRLNSFLKGYSGVSIDLVKHMSAFINKRILPIVPEHGAVGTSGDLVQLAHIALALIGDGTLTYNGKVFRTRYFFKKNKIKSYVLKEKEGLALINGTSLMTSISASCIRDSKKLLNLELLSSALALECVSAFSDCIDPVLHQIRPHSGQIYIASSLRGILRSSQLMTDRDDLEEKRFKTDTQVMPKAIQEIYSFRCVPQILGPIYETIRGTQEVVEIEMNSVSDNPIVDLKNKRFLHGGNFHGDYVASAVDHLKASIAKMTLLSERRINFFLNANINKSLPPFLNLHTPGLTLGLQGLQFVATSTAAQNQTLSFPHSIHSISTNGDNQDVVSMGTDAALFCAKVIDNAYVVLAIELVVLMQAVDFLKINTKLSRQTQKLYLYTRKQFPKLVDDRYMSEQLNEFVAVLKAEKNDF